MRQVGDTLVWLGLIVMVAAVLYFTPRLAAFVSAVQSHQHQGRVAWRSAITQADEIPDATP
jgi:hypothetical protein